MGCLVGRLCLLFVLALADDRHLWHVSSFSGRHAWFGMHRSIGGIEIELSTFTVSARISDRPDNPRSDH